jgi:hypothetical protein
VTTSGVALQERKIRLRSLLARAQPMLAGQWRSLLGNAFGHRFIVARDGLEVRAVAATLGQITELSGVPRLQRPPRRRW